MGRRHGFRGAPGGAAALHRRIEHGVFGYGGPWPSLTESVLAHLQGEYGWSIEPEWLVWLPGLVSGLNVACRAVDGEVLTATPIYPPFLSAPHFSGRKLNRVELARDNNRWHWDMAALQQATTAATRLFLFCHPHNPVGRCWSLRRTAGSGRLRRAQRSGRLLRRNPLRPDPRRRQTPHPVCQPVAGSGPTQHHAAGAIQDLQYSRPRLRLRGDSQPGAAPPLRAGHARHRAACDVLGLAACEAAFRHGGDCTGN